MEIYIETERLILRSWEYEDLEIFAEINSNRDVMKYFPATLAVDECHETYRHDLS
ncbi:MAG: GNAT family N-acetyltransferase [Muribaculaceae bacterium]|nr:GNAT family N-acetyltransferase [Muribaculaceae bacterium]